ncbi:hypothetical protein RB195_005786 [Necator americanus]|uniref:Uncharacterized protein n=1 Tax=Necator americanus TaxID=51031 RepID=A0ABR1BTE2_NECAM
MTKIIRSIWIDERIPDSFRFGGEEDYPGQVIQTWEETTRDEQASCRSGRSTIDWVLIIGKLIEMCQRYSNKVKANAIGFLGLLVAFDSIKY